jgi:hypothetical protein
MLHEVRLQVNSQENAQTSYSSAPTVIVLDAFTRGGSGVASDGSSRTFELAENLDVNVGRKQQMRVGYQIEGGRYKNFDARNAAGTFTFSSIDAYLAGTPTTFTQRIGQVNTSFRQYDVGFYWSDDVRLSNKLSFGIGVRNELQSHIDDRVNLMPRAGFTWTPWGNRTSIRGGYGLFYDWYESNLYDQTLRVNGVAQRDLLIINPGYPDPSSGITADVQPGGRVQASPSLDMPKVHQASVGVERQVTQNLTVQASYQMLRGRNQLRSININAPDALGARPDPAVGTVTQFDSTGRSQSDRLELRSTYRFPRRNIFMNVNYALSQVRNHADSATALPANNLDPNAEWGPSRQDIRHRVQGQVNVPLLVGVRSSVNFNAQSATPYSITTGFDDNRDGVSNDRPFGVGRNTERGRSTWTMNVNVNKQFAIGGVRGRQPGGTGGGNGRGGRGGIGPGGPAGAPVSNQVNFAQGQRGGQQGGGQRGGGRGNGGDAQANNNSRYTMELFIRADNVLNHVNYGGFSGNMLSPFFGRPTSAQQPRRLTVGTAFRF